MASLLTGSFAGSRSKHLANRSTSRRRGAKPREFREGRVTARKALGQHFLRDRRALRRIADACELTSSDTVIEIGPGLGVLTDELLARAGRVIAVELDGALEERLSKRLANTNATIVRGDALELAPSVLLPSGVKSYVVTGNLPYAIGQPLLRHYLEASPKPRRMVVMVQAEVAESMVAKPGELSLLGLSVQLYGEPRILFRLPPSAFYPPPKVRSAVVRIDVSASPRADVADVDAFFQVARAGFSTRRKQLRNALANGLGIDSAAASGLLARGEIDATMRAQEISLEEWAALASVWSELR